MRNRPSFWDFAYLTGLAPWDSEEPFEELTKIVEGGELRPCRVLDIGCGTGSNVVYLASKGFEAHGVDISRIAVSKAARKAVAKGARCFFHHLDFRDENRVRGLGKFDLAIDVGCYHSLPPGIDRTLYLSSLNAVLRRGGEYLLWCFVKGKPLSLGPPGVGEGEVEVSFQGFYEIAEMRRLRKSLRDLLFYHMRKVR